MIGGGRVIVMFKSVDPALGAHVLGARLAASASQAVCDEAGDGPGVTVGIADGDPGTETLALTCAAISAARQQEFHPASGPARGTSAAVVVVHTTLPRSESHSPRLAKRVVRPVSHLVTQTVPQIQLNGYRPAAPARVINGTVVDGSVLVVDTAPPAPGVPGPASAAVRSLVTEAGLSVTGTLAPSSDITSSMISLAGSIPRGAIVLLVVHPGNEGEGGEDQAEAMERPAALTQAFRHMGIRVLAVSVGATDIALAECILQGAENAFSLGELPEELIHALSHPNGDRSHTDQNGSPGEHSGRRIDRLGRLLLLTRSERRVLHHLTTGATAIEIADKLVLSLATVRSHIRSILRKLRVSSQLAAVAIAQGHPARSGEADQDWN